MPPAGGGVAGWWPAGCGVGGSGEGGWLTGPGGGLAQYGPDAAQGVDQARLPVVDLAPQVRDVRLHDVVVAAEVVLPYMVQDLRLGEHPVGVEHEVAQQLELGRRELDPVARPVPLVGLPVELRVGEGEPGRGLLA